MHRINPGALFIIDGSYLLYRAFYAIKPLHTSKGIPTNATFGFCRAIKKLIDQFDPSRLVIVWDSKTKVWRHEVYTEYKATRQKAPNDLALQREHIREIMDAIGVAQLSKDGYEGDDLVAALVKEHPHIQTVLVCADKDMYQLLGEHVLIFDPFKDRIIDEATFSKERGFGPEKTPFFYALLGDASDNVPGVPGVGEKTAQELVQQFDSLDDLYAHIDKVEKAGLQKKLVAGKESAYLSLKLVKLHPIGTDRTLDELSFDASGWHNADHLFTDLEFKSFIRQPQKMEGQTSLLETTSTVQPVATNWTCHIITTQEQLDSLIQNLKKTKTYALDTETDAQHPLLTKLVGISIAYNTTESFYIPIGHTHGTQLSLDTIRATLGPVLEAKDYDVTMHHAKFDQLVLLGQGMVTPPVTFDTLLAANLVKDEWQKINLKDLSLGLLGERMHTFAEVVPKNKTIADISINDAAQYAAHDSLQTFKLRDVLEKKLAKEPALKDHFEQIEMPFCWVLLQMEAKGILVDPEVLKEASKQLTHELGNIEGKILAMIELYTGKPIENFNLNSPKQLEHLLFDILQLPVIKKSSKGSRSTDQEVLQILSKQHPLPKELITYRELTKLKSTYLEPLPALINPTTKRIHTTYSQTYVATGRLSSAQPNMQNIPSTDQGYGSQIRQAFIAPHGYRLMSADYSQIELRILAYLSQDATLLETFKNNEDIHTQTAAQLFDIAVDNVTHEQRQLGKRINFSIMYGITPYGLSQDLGISASQAKQYIEKYFAQYPAVRSWMDGVIQAALECGYVETLRGRRRYIPELKERNKNLLEAGKRMAVNSVVQGTQAELMKLAMIALDQKLQTEKLDATMLLQIHDEIVLEVAHDQIEQVETLVHTVMEHIVSWNVPLLVSTRTGSNWAQVSK